MDDMVRLPSHALADSFQKRINRSGVYCMLDAV